MDKPIVALVVGVAAAVIAALIVAFLHIGGSSGGSNPTSAASQQDANKTQPSSSPSSVGGAGTPAPLPTSQCVFLWPNQLNCASSDPEITLEGDYTSSTVGCTWSDQVNWGDGSPDQTFNVPGGPAGPVFISDHTYHQKGTFSITLIPTVVSGSCYSINGSYTFTYG
jgi:hypothetical protein